jgi:hypothetical protein
LSDGTGTNKTTSLTVSVVYGTEGATYTLRSSASTTCYITKLQARGYGIYTYATLESIIENTTSINSYGYSSETIHQQYQQNTVIGKTESYKILENYKQPRTILNNVQIQANKSEDFMWGFLLYDSGDMINIKEDQTGIDSDYYIHGVNFIIFPASVGGMETGTIDYGWTVKQAQTLSSGDYGLSLIAAELSFFGPSLRESTNNVNFGCLNYLNNLTSKSFSLWFNVTTDGILIDKGAYSSSGRLEGIRITVDPNTSKVYFIEYDGTWYADAVISTGAWHNLVITKQTSIMNTAPVIYLDGVSKTINQTSTQTMILSETGHGLYIGKNIFGSGADVTNSVDGKLKDIRIYSNILTAAQALGIYNEGAGGTGYLSDIQFQGPVVKKSDLTYFTDHTMTADDMLIDNIYGMIGKAQCYPAWTLPITRLP